MGKGGKGGFGALLRHAAKRVGAKKNRNFGAMRDLYGRRIRNVEADKKIIEWTKLKRQELIEKRDAKRKKQEEERSSIQLHVENRARMHQEVAREVRERIGDAVSDVLRNRPGIILESARSSITASRGKDIDLNRKRVREDEEVDEEKAAAKARDIFDRIAAGADDLGEYLSSDDDSDEEEALCAVLEVMVGEAEEDIEEDQEGDVAAVVPSAPPSPLPAVGIDLEAISTLDELLEQYDMNALKFELNRRGMKCGGTLAERSSRLWSVRGIDDPAKYPVHVLAKR